MKIATFWSLIEQSRSAVTQTKDHAEALVETLTELKVKDVSAFARHLFSCQSVLYRHDLWTCCYLLCGGHASDDGFKDFRAYVISLGRAAFESALRDPDSLADHVPPDEYPSYEVFAYTADNAYNRKTGSRFYEDGIEIEASRKGFVMWELTRPGGEPITLEDAPKYLPKTHKRFREGMGRELAQAKQKYASDDPGERRYSLNTFEHFLSHSKEALDVLQAAGTDSDEEVRQQAKESLERHRRATERT